MRRYGSAEAAITAIPTLAKRGGSKISLASIASVKDELESIDAAGAVLGIAIPVLEGRGRALQGTDAGHGEEENGRLVHGQCRGSQRQRIVGPPLLAGAQDDRNAAVPPAAPPAPTPRGV